MTTVNKYLVFCIDENDFFPIWSETEPTLCPNDHADRSIDSARTLILETLDENIVKAEEHTDGYFESEHIRIDIPSGTPGDITEHDVSWIMNIILWKTYLTPTSDMIGDEISVLASPETTIGVLTAPANIGDTVINVNSTVIDNAYRGFLVTIDDTVNKDVVGRLSNIDSGNSQITFETPLSYAYAAGTPVKISVYVLKNIYISDTNIIDIGAKGFKGKGITAGTILRVYYTNNSGTAKTFRWRAELYNDG